MSQKDSETHFKSSKKHSVKWKEKGELEEKSRIGPAPEVGEATLSSADADACLEGKQTNSLIYTHLYTYVYLEISPANNTLYSALCSVASQSGINNVLLIEIGEPWGKGLGLICNSYFKNDDCLPLEVERDQFSKLQILLLFIDTGVIHT